MDVQSRKVREKSENLSRLKTPKKEFFMLMLERHKLHLMSFPQGDFRHQVIPPASAKMLIDEAIACDELYATYLHDNRNPKRAENEWLKFCRLLIDHFDIVIDESLFFETCEGHKIGELLEFGKPAGLMPISKEKKLLLVDYGYTMPNDFNKALDDDALFDWPIAIDSVKFHLFEMIENSN